MIRAIYIWYLRDKLKRNVRHQYALHYQELLFGQSYERKVRFSLRLIIKGLREGLPFNKEVIDTRDIRRDKNDDSSFYIKLKKKWKRYTNVRKITGNVYHHSGSQKSTYKIPKL